MDPCIESSGLWPDFHERFLAHLSETLQPILPDNYYAVLQTREEIGIAGLAPELVAYPDVAVKGQVSASRQGQAVEPDRGGVLLASQPEQLTAREGESLRVSFLEVREVPPGGRLVTLIELLSPSNKAPGADRDAFACKQASFLASDVHWVEIDLLRAGEKLACHPSFVLHCRRKCYDYSVVVSRSSRRRPRLVVDFYGFALRARMPVISLPLREPDKDVLVDLGAVLHRTHAAGPYRKALAYDREPVPPVTADDMQWIRERVAATRRDASA
jgi:hypothetical protein